MGRKGKEGSERGERARKVPGAPEVLVTPLEPKYCDAFCSADRKKTAIFKYFISHVTEFYTAFPSRQQQQQQQHASRSLV